MDASPTTPKAADIMLVQLLSQLLQRLERSREPLSAQQYRSVAQHLAHELDGAPLDAALQQVLNAFPAAAQLYENLTYQHAGLSRSPLELAVAAELQAREAIARAMRSTAH